MTPDSLPTPGGQPAGTPGEADVDAADPGDVDVDVDAGAAVTRARTRRRRYLTGAVLLAASGLVGALFLPTPYYLLEPGSVRPAEQRIVVEGAESFDTDGNVLFTTVVIDPASLGQLVRAWLDDAIVVKDEEEVYGGQDRTQTQRVNQQRMDLSKLVATQLGLEYVGFPAEFTAEGARVLELMPDSPSEGRLRPGDVITRVDGADVAVPGDIGDALAGRAPGDTVAVSARRPAATGTGAQAGTRAGADEGAATVVEAEVTLGVSEDDPARPVLGVVVDPADPRIESDVSVRIDSGNVTGPSAGLAWALAVVDRLTPGSLTDGREVGVTGELLPDGTVGAIGGIVQKVAAVKRAGVEVFLYPADTPAGEQRAMRRVAGDAVELVPVATLDEAVRALRPGGVPDVGPGDGG